jgi:hypothetical protein
MSDPKSQREWLVRAAQRAQEFLDTLPDRAVGSSGSFADVRAAMDRPLPDLGLDPSEAIEALVRGAEAGLVGSAGPRYFGFVIGGSLPAALAADWLTATWDQNVLSLLHRPQRPRSGHWRAGCETCSGFQPGRHWLRNRRPDGELVGLASGRHAVLAGAGWDVEDRLAGAAYQA